MQHASHSIITPSVAAWRAQAIDVACALFAVLPLVLTAHVPLYDLPNHMAMLHVLLERAANPTLQKIYGVHWAFVPNMGLQVAAWLLSPLLSVEASVRLFCIATVLLLCAGTRALSLALTDGKAGVRLYRAAPLLCWGAPLQYGFASYCFGTGLMLVGLAAYVRLRRRSWPRLAVVFIPFCILLLATHLIAYGLFVAGLAGCELAHALQRPTKLRARTAWLGVRAVIVASLTLPALLVLLLAPRLGDMAAPKFAHPLLWSTPFQKAQGIAAITWFAMPGIEMPLLLAALACLGISLWLRWLRPHPVMIGMVCALSAVWLALPRNVPAGHYVDFRVPWAISLVALAGFVPCAPLYGQRAWREAAGYILVALVVLRVGSVSWRVLRWEPELAAVDRAMSALPVGTSLWVIRGVRNAGTKSPPFEHAAAFIVTRRQGFEPHVFAGAAGELVYLERPYRELYDMVVPAKFTGLPAAYGAVLVINPELASVPVRPGLHCAAMGPHFLLLTRDGPPSACK